MAAATGANGWGAWWFRARLVHGAMVAAVAAYLVLVYAVTGEARNTDPLTFEQGQLLFIVLGGAGLATLVALPLVRARLMPPSAPPASLDDTIAADAPIAAEAEAALQKNLSGHIVSWGMAESVALCGVILAILVKAIWPYALFALPALIALLLTGPSRAGFEGVVRASQRS